MSFRKRNVVLGTPSRSPATRQPTLPSPGTRPSPLDGRPTTSTGTASLDQLLAGHAGLPLGHSLLIEESSTTDFGGVLLRYYTAEGLVQGHHVHVLGFDESWRRDLPGLDDGSGKNSDKKAPTSSSDEKMKIAWRYETLGNRAPAREATVAAGGAESATFCHSFSLAKRLEGSASQGQLLTTPIPMGAFSGSSSPFQKFLLKVTNAIKSSPPSTIHRIVVPSLLSPTIYQSVACQPKEVLQFLHGLRALLRRFSTQTTAMVTLPVSLYPRSTGLVRWAELLAGGVLELIPTEHKIQTSGNPKEDADKAQGMLRAHSLPVFHEKGGGLEGSWNKEDLSFRLSSSSGLVITPFSLPPLGETEEMSTEGNKKDAKKESLEF